MEPERLPEKGICVPLTPRSAPALGCQRQGVFPCVLAARGNKSVVFHHLKLGYFSPSPLADFKCGFHINPVNKAWRHLDYISLTIYISKFP